MAKIGRPGLPSDKRQQVWELRKQCKSISEMARATGSPAGIVQDILTANGIAFPTVDTGWRGTTRLTTVPQCNAAERLFVIGDAAGYVEPFTGEGMAAALEDALAIGPWVVQAARRWRPELATSWQRLQRGRFRSRQRVCQVASLVLRRPWLAETVLSLLGSFPSVAAYFVRAVSRPSVLFAPPRMEKS